MESWYWPGKLLQVHSELVFTSSPAASENRSELEDLALRISQIARHGKIHLALLIASALFIALPVLGRIVLFRRGKPASKVTFLYKRPILYDVVLQGVIGAALAISIVLATKISVSPLEPALLAYISAIRFVHVIVSRKQQTKFRRVFGVQTILLLCLSTVLALAMDVLPVLLIHRDFTISPLKLAKALLLLGSLVVLMFSPRNAVKIEYRAPISMSVAKMEDLETEKDLKATPEEYCAPVTYFMTYGWLNSVIMAGWNRALSLEDLPPLPHYDEPFIWLGNIIKARQRGVTTLKTIIILMHKEITLQFLFAAMVAFCDFIPPFAMNRLLSYLETPEKSVFHPGVWVLLLFVGPMMRSFSFQQYIFSTTRLVVRVKSALVQEIFHKALNSIIFEKLPAGAKQETDEAGEETQLLSEDQKLKEAKTTAAGESGVGHIINLMSSDIQSIVVTRDMVLVSMAVPIDVTISMIFLHQLIGWSALVGLAVMLISFTIPSYISRQMMLVQRKVMARSDVRISIISEYLSSIRIIKYFGWEQALAEKVMQARDLELAQIWKRKLWSVASTWAGDFIPLLTLFVMLTTFTIGTGQQLRAATAFTCLSIIETLRQVFVRAADMSAKLAEGSTSFKRIDTFFRTVTLKTPVETGNPSFKNATFRRSPSGPFRLQDVNVEFLPGTLNVITGPTGCGKTSMLLSLLGETILESGRVSCPEDSAYVSQSAWLQNGTVRENILFHSEFDQVRYDATIRACGLLTDLDELPHGDFTQVAEQGAVLSGGQQQRVALARAVYSNASTLLLDDVFSALDIHTTNHIYNAFFREGFLGDRTVILVSHLPALIDAASLVVRVESGKVVDVSTKASSKTPSTAVDSDDETAISETPETGIMGSNIPKPAVIIQKKLEASSKGRIPRGLFFQYILCFGSYPYAILALCTAFTAQATFFSITLWLSVWTGAYSKPEAINVGYYIAVYAAILASFNFMVATNNFVFQYGSWRAARALHTKLLKAVFAVPISWFDSQAIGTIINRFSTDMQILDTALVQDLRTTLDVQIRLCLRIGGIASIMPIFALPAAVFCSMGFMVGEMYTRTQISIKRLTSTTQSPIFAHFSETLTGLPIIRAQSGMKEIFGVILADRIRQNSRAFEALYNSNRWVSVRADAVAATVSACAGIIAIMKASTISAGLVGFSLTNAIGLSQTILAMVRNMNELEVELNSFQRIQEYAALKSEEDEVEAISERVGPLVKPPAAWPTSGEVVLSDFSASYGVDGSNVLKSISLTARPGERIGIVGRTGSGKSSLGLSLLRFTHRTGGSITIDGIDISTLALSDLRRAVTIIPQEPTLFAGDVRTNLDPFNELDETELTTALNACNFSIATSDEHAPTTPLTLTTPISTDGSNFSRGQRQILAMARAICRRSKIVLLDEATSSVDDQTDEQIQQVLRTEFPGSTIFTIAHRLGTVMDYDRIVVMGEGRVLEVGKPDELMGREGGVFRGMVDELGM